MAIQKIRLTSPAADFSILGNPKFFTVDRLGVNHTFYEIPKQKATCDNPVKILFRARRSYRGYFLGFTNVVLRSRVVGSGTWRQRAMSKGPTLLPLIVSLARQTPAAAWQTSGTWSLERNHLELFTDKPRNNPNQDVRGKDKKTIERNSKINNEEKLGLQRKSMKHYNWKNYAPPEHQDGYVPPVRAGPWKSQNLPPANLRLQQTQGRLKLTTELLKGVERERDQPPSTLAPAVTWYRAQGRDPLKGDPREEDPGHQGHHLELHHLDQHQGGEHQQPLQSRVWPIWPNRYWYGHTDIQQTDTNTNTPFHNLYQTDTDICFEIHIKLIIGIYLY